MIIYQDVLKEFNKENLKFVLVGGIAFNLLGGNRATQDLDILVEMSNENLTKVVTILKRLGYYVKQPVDPMGIADEKTRREWIEEKGMKAFNFYKEKRSYEEVDIIIESPVGYEEAKKDARIIKVDDITIPVISIKNLIKMKSVTGRARDMLDIKELREIEGLQGA